MNSLNHILWCIYNIMGRDVSAVLQFFNFCDSKQEQNNGHKKPPIEESNTQNFSPYQLRPFIVAKKHRAPKTMTTKTIMWPVLGEHGYTYTWNVVLNLIYDTEFTKNLTIEFTRNSSSNRDKYQQYKQYTKYISRFFHYILYKINDFSTQNVQFYSTLYFQCY